MNSTDQRRLAILTFVSLDGVMQAPKLPEEDRSYGFELGGWADAYWDEVMQLVLVEAMHKPYDLLLGRKTYDQFAKFNANDQEDNMLNKLTKYVVSKSNRSLEWSNSILMKGNPIDNIKKLKSEKGPLLQVHGSWQLIQTLLNHGLVDEFRLLIFPVILGSGKRLFADGNIPKELKLQKSSVTKNGVVMCIYKTKHSMTYGI